MNNDHQDPTWHYDFGKLLQFAGGTTSSEIGRAVLYGSKPPPNDSLWAAAKHHGFEVVVHDRSRFTGREKKVDTSIVTDMMRDGYELMKPGRDTFTLVAGDADYVPTIRALCERRFTVDVCFWGQASRELRDECSNFISLACIIHEARASVTDGA